MDVMVQVGGGGENKRSVSRSSRGAAADVLGLKVKELLQSKQSRYCFSFKTHHQ